MDEIVKFLKGNSFSLIICLIIILFFLISFKSIFSFTTTQISLNNEVIRNDINIGPVIAEFKNVFSQLFTL